MLEKFKVDIPIFLAPMAGVTDLPFRCICKSFGADVLITEMISTRGLLYGDKKTRKLLTIDEKEHPVGVQLFGNDPMDFYETVKKIEHIPFDFININMGCPTPKIVKNNDGCALMKDISLAQKIIERTVKATSKPVTVKIRKGWDKTSQNAVEFSKAAQESGASLIIIHGRTRESFYSGKADWNIIKKVKDEVSIPVIGNGDIFSPQDAKKMLDITGCDGIMIGRGAMGKPWIFRDVKRFLSGHEKSLKMSLKEIFKVILKHLDKSIEFHGERVGILEMRKHIAWYLKGLPYSTSVKRAIQVERDRNKIEQILRKYFQNLIKYCD